LPCGGSLPLRSRKNSVSSAPHSSANTPGTISVSWFRRGSAPRL